MRLMRLYLKRIICIAAAFSLAVTPVSVHASTTSDKIKQVEKEQANTKDKLGETQDTLDQLISRSGAFLK